MKKLKDLKIEESSEEVKGEGEMQWGGIMFRFYFSVGLELNQEWIYQSRTTRAYRLSVAAAVCKSGFVGEGEAAAAARTLTTHRTYSTTPSIPYLPLAPDTSPAIYMFSLTGMF